MSGVHVISVNGCILQAREKEAAQGEAHHVQKNYRGISSIAPSWVSYTKVNVAT